MVAREDDKVALLSNSLVLYSGSLDGDPNIAVAHPPINKVTAKNNILFITLSFLSHNGQRDKWYLRRTKKAEVFLCERERVAEFELTHQL